MPTRWMAGAAALLLAFAILAASWMLRSKPPTVSVGDEALLEIYTLHAARGSLTVGAYSRFFWNHPGPTLFYFYAPGYVLSGYREDSLFATTLLANVAAFAALLWCLRKYWGNSVAIAAAIWFLVLLLHPGSTPGWDFGDWLGSSWNPHAPMVPLALLIAVAAGVAAGVPGLLAAMAGLASFVIQAHVGLAPVSLAATAVSVGLFGLTFMERPHPRHKRGPVPFWAKVVDSLALAYAVLLLWVLVFGGFDVHIGGTLITVNSGTRLATYIVALLLLRHAGSREHPAFVALAERIVRWRWLTNRGTWPPGTKAGVAAAVLVGLALWLLPLVQQVTASGPGNLTILARFAGEGGAPDLGAGIAAFTYYLSGVVWRGLDVAAGGRTIRGADIGWTAVFVSTAQLVLLGAILRRALARNQTFRIALCIMCLVTSAAAFASLLHVTGGLYDHLAFWIVMVGLINLTVITGVGLEWLWSRHAVIQRWCRPSMAVPVLVVSVVTVAACGARHLLAGHQQARFADDVAAVRTLCDALDTTLGERGPTQQSISVDAAQDAWSVTAGIVLELYKRGTDVTVARPWVPIFGVPLAPHGREMVEVTLADHERSRILADDPAYQLVGRTATIDMYLRRLSRANRVKLRSPPL
ncbi:MAG: hypothetical protein ABI634_07495 [Acidobacteriota bacterium]